MRNFSILTLLFFIVSTFSLAQEGTQSNEQMIRALKKLDQPTKTTLPTKPQLVREEPATFDGKVDPPKVEMTFESIKVNSANAKVLYQRNGWPLARKVGEELTHKFWLIVYNSDHDVKFQVEVLKAMKGCLKKGDASKKDFAFLMDKVLVNRGKKQRYGTQVLYNPRSKKYEPYMIEKPNKVNELRAEMGLSTLQEYLKELN